MKKILLSLLIILISSDLSAGATFIDIQEFSPHSPAINELEKLNIVSGFADNTFKSDLNITRAQALKIIMLSADIQSEIKIEKYFFDDVKNEDWYSPYIYKAFSIGLINGFPDNKFHPNNPITKAEFIKILFKAHNFELHYGKDDLSFSDVQKNSWFYPYFVAAYENNFVLESLQGGLLPEKKLARGESADLIFKMIIYKKTNRDTQELLDYSENYLIQSINRINQKDFSNAYYLINQARFFLELAKLEKSETKLVNAVFNINEAMRMICNAFYLNQNHDFINSAVLAREAKYYAQKGLEFSVKVDDIAEKIIKQADILINISLLKS